MEQSPIDLTDAEAFDLVGVQTNYQPSALTIFNNGHTVQANYDAGSTLVVNGVTYELAQFHFHTPSEHTIDGVAFPMEVHFVHRSADGDLAVIGVMLVEGKPTMKRSRRYSQHCPARRAIRAPSRESQSTPARCCPPSKCSTRIAVR
ncbi:carbonic anhydrase family protein [Candidatus Flexifilum breve]|uniref:carbonic anhydrase family protein n=1 Tax=Candidatus Flexifilum breve TaxID=3140694 RepID=UPI0031CC4885